MVTLLRFFAKKVENIWWMSEKCVNSLSIHGGTDRRHRPFMTMHTIIEQFAQYLSLELNYSDLTVKAYRNDLNQWCEALTGGKEEPRLESATAADVRNWMVQRGDAGDCARTLRRKVQSVRALYKYMMKRGLTDENPAADVELARTPQRLPSHVRQRSMDELLDRDIDTGDFNAVRDHLVVMMLYSTGMRQAELIGLQDALVDTGRGELKVHGKRDKDRVIPFGNELKRWIELYRSLRDTLGIHDKAFFVRETGGSLYPSMVYRIVHNSLQSVGGSDKMSPHVLRHTFASVMLNNGAGLESVKELLGHESLATTQLYTHITFNQLKDNYKHAHPRAQKKGE